MTLRRCALACLAAACLSPVGPAPVLADGNAGAPIAETGPDPCHFFRGRALGKGVDHYATEMLWVCDAIADRRAAALPMSDRLRATEAALDGYRREVLAASVADFVRRRAARDLTLGLSEADTLRIAEETGALGALEAVRAGF